jgi:hypothetical protein
MGGACVNFRPMKTAFFAMIVSIGFFAHADSISDLPGLSKLIVHHYDCRVAILPSAGTPKELLFRMPPYVSGHQTTDYTLTLGTDKVVASANTQMIEVDWTRGNQTVADAQAWIQNTASMTQVLMVQDPKDPSSQVHLSCNGVTYEQWKAGVK